MGILRTGISNVGIVPVSMMGSGALGTYRDKVLSYGPIAYWMLAEAAGLTAMDQVNSPLQDGTHVGVTLGQPGIGDGNICPLYDGIVDYTNVYSATFAGAFDGAEGSVMVWAKVSGVGVWTDGTDRTAVSLAYDGFTNRIRIYRQINDNVLLWLYEAGDIVESVAVGSLSDIDWMMLALTWSKTADQMKAYKDGVQVGATQTTLGVWAGALSSVRTLIGDRTTTNETPWSGNLAHCAVWDTPLSGPDILDLATI